ncbi:GNAT family N-acetyltransferase [Pseudorhodobacter sp.]|uniref:GNAT family N-acetyltransferase n=1 Tax=Pseudorhodobacter sp. TaxID=1934400 RepID=UPI0026499239|nr:GNAT family N-acetyltransferase [Pseudorhodobacter sp.]MDN5789215.1 GNAT family N-acetyltransferase [Pseudorhodobacter sp.]
MQIHTVSTADIPMLHQLLAQLSHDLGDTHAASLDALTAAAPNWRGLLAMEGQMPMGALLASPLFSTTRGGTGLYISDLWIAEAGRGQGLGARLLAAALREWQPVFVKLSVYTGNARAKEFYTRCGFAHQDETNMILHGAALDHLKGRR